MSTVSRATQCIGYVQAAVSSATAGVLAVTAGSGGLSWACLVLGAAIAVKATFGRVQESSRDACPLSKMPPRALAGMGAALSCVGLMTACLALWTTSLGWAAMASLLIWGGGVVHLQSLNENDPHTYCAGGLMNMALLTSWVMIVDFMCRRVPESRQAS